MKASNWPLNDNRAHPNWVGRTPRTTEWGGAWAPGTHRIPRRAWIGAAVVIAIFAGLMYVGSAAGF